MPVVWIFILLLKERKNPTDPLSHFKSAGLHVHKAYFFSVSSLIWKYFLISCYISNHSLGHIRLFFNSHDFLIAYFKKSLLFFFFGYIVLNFMFLLFTSFRSLLSKWFALAAQIYLNRDSLKIVSVLICIEGGKMRIINIIFVAVLFWLSACLS